ncbi:MAG: hypothetical protein PHV34_24740 [Verrucomicrobiae bacterium]|nr:hypothetical protein [Verrucomicrobiae bacterium]
MKRIDFDPELLELIRLLPRDRRHAIGEAIAATQEAFGQPHQHTGVGLRKLSGQYYEIRMGLDQRLVFEEIDDALYFQMIGNHNDVKRFLKSH